MAKWQDIYQARLTTAEEAVKVIKSGDRVVPGHGGSESELLVGEMVKVIKNWKMWNCASGYLAVRLCQTGNERTFCN